jgi:hydroxypyruvate isomerase
MLNFTANLSLLFTEVDLIQRFKAAKQYGFSAVEIQFPYACSAKSLKDGLDNADQKLILFNVDAGDLLQGEKDSPVFLKSAINFCKLSIRQFAMLRF